MTKLREAMDTLDGVIPPPDNKMVDLDHLPIATAWQECRKALVTYDDMQSKHDTLIAAGERWSKPSARRSMPGRSRWRTGNCWKR